METETDIETHPETEASLREMAADAEREAAGVPPADDAAPASAPAAAVPDPELTKLKEEVARQKTEIARLTQLTSLYSGSGSGSPPAPPKKFEDLTDREMEGELRRMARGLDGF